MPGNKERLNLRHVAPSRFAVVPGHHLRALFLHHIHLKALITLVLACTVIITGCSQTVGTAGSGTSTEVVGCIKTPEGCPVGNTPVYLLHTIFVGTSSFVDTITAISSARGAFAVQVDSAGRYLLVVKDTAGRRLMEEVVVQGTAGCMSLGTLYVNTAGALHGFIRDNTNFKANTIVQLYKGNTPFAYLWRRGAFTVDSLPPGEVRVRICGTIDNDSLVTLKPITFTDAVRTILPGKTTIIDTVFINQTEVAADSRAASPVFKAPGVLATGIDYREPDCGVLPERDILIR